MTLRPALFSALMLSPLAVMAQQDGPFARYGFQTGFGTTGVELGISRPVDDTRWVARASLGKLSGEERSREGSILYNAKLNLTTSVLGADYHFFNGRFKGSLGLALFGGDIAFNSVAQAGDTITVGNRRVVVGPNDFVRASFKLPSVAPYVCLGWSNLNANDPGFSYALDLGVTFVTVKTNLQVSQNLETAAGSDQVAAERQKLQDSANDLKVYPVVRAVLGYRF